MNLQCIITIITNKFVRLEQVQNSGKCLAFCSVDARVSCQVFCEVAVLHLC